MGFKHVHVTIDEDLWKRKDPKKTWGEVLEAGVKAFEPWVGQIRFVGIKETFVGDPDSGMETPLYEHWNGKKWANGFPN